ncbi:unnamed protein product [Caenorhabditis bovis]|uniref:Fungal lipase-type domain-containing protein n=1 Tax=Caenorhabditis bovis TaxID=2654633 RepID=A0A8S1FBN2_9PELO|nr:unnamed protein product [Caenorhabditis bovis]
MLFPIFVFLIFSISQVSAKSCEECLSEGNHYCPSVKACNFSPCPDVVKKPINCPWVPNSTYAYDDHTARTLWLPLIGAGATDAKHAQLCFDNNWPTLKVSKHILVNCSNPHELHSQCSMITAYDTTKKIIVMTFRGTTGNGQMADEILSFFGGKRKFFDSGMVFEYFYDAFNSLWNGGLGTEIRNLKYLYPDFELWASGHSLGGSLASVGASWVVKTGLFKPEKIKLLTVGQPRTGDYDYAWWHQNTFLYSYRVVHHKDPVPHIPPQYELDKDRMYHHRTEIWYNNNMEVGSKYHICPEADGFHCSNQQLDPIPMDHIHYYNVDLGTYGGSGCPRIN